jgi:hypothetical protein
VITLKKLLIILMCCIVQSTHARNIIAELKGACFLPTDCLFKKIYHKASGLYGAEISVQLREDCRWYGFASVDYMHKKGHSIGLHSPTEVKLMPLAVGLKYVVPSYRRCFDWYVGLGFEVVRVSTTDYSSCALLKESQWAYGGIAKAGMYYYLPHNYVLDIFVNYSYAKTRLKNNKYMRVACVEQTRANVSGALIGIGLGYNF